MEEFDPEVLYRRRILLLYATGLVLNAWFLYELLKETPKGREILQKIKSPWIKIRAKKDSALHGQLIIDEAEKILRGQNG